MDDLQILSLQEIQNHLKQNKFPFSGITELGTAEFHFMEPAHYVGVALHAGNRIRAGLSDPTMVQTADRYREEDPYTEIFIRDFPIQIIARDSRFEYDLNWEMERSIYDYGKKKWGLEIWNRPLTGEEIRTTENKFREFHQLLEMAVDYILQKMPHAIIFDIHSFCYQREQKVVWYEDEKPEINLGTVSINRKFFSKIIDPFLEEMSGIALDGRKLRVAENLLFPGGYLTRKYSRDYPEKVLVLAVEFKKIFMDEWSGEVYEEKLDKIVEGFLRARDLITKIKI